MSRRNRIPAYYGKNIAQQAQRKYLHDKKPESQRVEEHRQAAANVICLCYLVALNDKYGVGESSLQRVVDDANARAERFDTNKRAVGMERAKKKLDEELGDLLPGGFVLPVTKSPKNNRDWRLLSEQRDAAEIVVKLYSLAAHKTLGFGAERIAETVKGTEENFRKFGEWAEGGDYYGYALLARRLSAILGEPVEVDEQDADEPIFSHTLT